MRKRKNKKDYQKKQYDTLLRWISYYHQINLIKELSETIGWEPKILEVGVGNKTVSNYIKNAGFDVVTCDLVPDLEPDVVCDIRNLQFYDNSFDIVVACEVMEHLRFEDFDKCLKELARVSRQYVIISLPYWNASIELLIKFPILGVFKDPPFFNPHLEIPYFFRTLKSEEHYWECGAKGYPMRLIKKYLRTYFNIIGEKKPQLNNHHRFFILEVKEKNENII